MVYWTENTSAGPSVTLNSLFLTSATENNQPTNTRCLSFVDRNSNSTIAISNNSLNKGEDIDTRFVQCLRDIRMHFNARDALDTYCQHLLLFSGEVLKQLSTNRNDQEHYALSGNGLRHVGLCKTLLRNALNIGASLLQSKEFKNIFIDIVEKLIDPCREDGKWSRGDIELFFLCALKAFVQLVQEREIGENDQDRSRYLEVYEQFMTGLMLCMLRLY